MTKEDNKSFKNSTKCWICNNDYMMMMLKSDHCHITGEYRDSTNKDIDIDVNLNHKIPVVSHNLKNLDYHLIMQELGKFNVKINVIPNELKNIYELYYQQQVKFY